MDEMILRNLQQLIADVANMVNARRPVGIDDGLVVCSDGAVFSFVDCGKDLSYWREIVPIPGTAEAREQARAEGARERELAREREMAAAQNSRQDPYIMGGGR